MVPQAFTLLERCVAEGLVPGAVAAVGTAEGTLHRQAFGWASLTPQRRPLAGDDLFDLASLTKIVVTTTIALRFLEQGRLFLEQPLAAVLPAFRDGDEARRRVTFRHLLTHTSGLPAWKDLRPEHRDGPDAPRAAGAPPLEAALSEPLERPPGAAVVYSDLGYIALGTALSAVGGAPLPDLARHEVLVPLGMEDATYLPSPAARERCAATEDVPDRGGVLQGVVHDDNAGALGGVAGHAGLFATCADLERFCRMWLGMGRLEGRRDGQPSGAPDGWPFLSPATVRLATRDHTSQLMTRSGPGQVAALPGSASRRGLGWVLQPNPFWVPADLCSPQAYGHTGYTGTSLLLDPVAGIFAVLLTNRVHPSRENGSAGAVREVRARFHNAVWAALAG
jgi:CubicO group peptidase (beta-lactamase class C family)